MEAILQQKRKMCFDLGYHRHMFVNTQLWHPYVLAEHAITDLFIFSIIIASTHPLLVSSGTAVG